MSWEAIEGTACPGAQANVLMCRNCGQVVMAFIQIKTVCLVENARIPAH